jgi:hypothetical protein
MSDKIKMTPELHAALIAPRDASIEFGAPIYLAQRHCTRVAYLAQPSPFSPGGGFRFQ